MFGELQFGAMLVTAGTCTGAQADIFLGKLKSKLPLTLIPVEYMVEI